MGLLATVPLVLMRRRLKLAAVLIAFSTVFVIGTATTPMTGAGIVAQAWVFLLLAERYRGAVSIALGTGSCSWRLSDGEPRRTGVLADRGVRRRAGDRPLAAGSRRCAAREEQAVLEERARIARELHDVIAHHVSAIAIQADTGRLTDAADGAAQFEAIGDTAREAMTEMRRVLGVLRADAGASSRRSRGSTSSPAGSLRRTPSVVTEGTPVAAVAGRRS